MLGEGWYRRRELFTRCRGTRPFNSYGRNDNIVGGGEEWLENASSSTPACIVTLRDEFEKDNFSARFAIRREWNGRRMPRSVVADSFQTNFSRRFERERERKGDGHRFDGIRSSSSSSSSLVVPLLFQLGRHSACHRSVSHSFLVSKKEESKTPRQNFSASPSIRGMITVREGRFSLSRSLFSLPCLSSPFLPFFSILSFSIEESAKRAIVFCLSQHPRFHNNRVGV